MNSPPTVMVSSTFYDLRHLRAELARFISDELGYVALLSELPSFPVNPDLDTVDNCRARVEQDADIFVLVVGGRYGSIDDKTDSSITNLEFLAARSKSIPIYAFVDKRVWIVLDVWRRNPSADFSGVVDTPRLFEFIEYIAGQQRVWMFPFETAADVVGVLRRQFAYLVNDALRLRRRVSGSEPPYYFSEIGPTALRIALERPRGWEYLLFLHSWIDQVQRRRAQIKEYQSGIALAAADFVAASSAGDWLQTRLHELSAFIDSANRLVNSSGQAFGPPGQPGNAEDIVWIASMLGALLDSLLSWARRIRCARFQAPFETINAQLALFVDDVVGQFQTFPVDALAKVTEALAQSSTGERRQIELTMPFRLANLERFNQELENARSRLPA